MTIRPSWCGITHWIMLKPRRHEPWTAASADGGSMRVVSNQQITADCRSLKTQNPPGGAGVSGKAQPGLLDRGRSLSPLPAGQAFPGRLLFPVRRHVHALAAVPVG